MVKENNLYKKLCRLRMRRGVMVSFISVPTPVLADRDKIISPNRTNYYPSPQLVLASCVRERFKSENIPWTVSFGDYKSIDPEKNFDDELLEYGKVKYGRALLLKYIVGDGMTRIRQELTNKDIVCITANFTFESNIVRKTILAIKEVNTKALIILGGRDASARHDSYLRFGADLVAIGDSDIGLPELLSRVYWGEDVGDLVRDACLINRAEGRATLSN